MKKYVIAVVSCLCLFLSSCASKFDENAIQAYEEALNSLQNCSGMNIDMKMFAYEDVKQERLMAKLTMDGAILKLHNDLQMSMNAYVAANGIAIDNLKFYMKDANMYVDALGTKVKIPLADAFFDFNEIVGSQTNIDQEDFAAFIHETMDEFRYEDQEAGIIAFSLQDAFIQEYMDQSTNSNGASIKRFDGTITIKENQIIAYSFLFDMETNGQPYTVVGTISLADFDQIKEIAFPDFSEFVLDDFDISEGL